MPPSFRNEEVAEIIERHRELKLKGPGELEGIIRINHAFDGVTLEDEFLVRISANSKPLPPVLREIGGRTDAIAAKYNLKDSSDLHCNPGDSTACVAVPQELAKRFPQGSSLLVYVEELAIPYLYGLGFYDQHGRWPWPEHSHGAVGMLEFYASAPEQNKQSYEETIRALRGYGEVWPAFKKQLRKPSAKRACICGSRKEFRQCHPEALRGIREMRDGLLRLGLSPDHLTK